MSRQCGRRSSNVEKKQQREIDAARWKKNNNVVEKRLVKQRNSGDHRAQAELRIGSDTMDHAKRGGDEVWIGSRYCA
jgi:uncharacterized protein (DUF4415 family)